jgi:hypothetical protein
VWREALMPAKTERQAKFMRYCAHADHPASKCPSRKVAREFMHTTKRRASVVGR